ncbi:MAG TPA: FtsW/RodA/SpoVE family cell cycle protein [Marinilabiliaceae bacterium]|nr:FtsW/RodA/SpoVE family cell cycle protein [Marinilabiliaceae bacterium]
MTAFFKKYVKGDAGIWWIIIILSIASLLSVYSATGYLAYKMQGGNTSYYLFKQLISLGFGIGIIIFMLNVKSNWVAGLSLIVLYLSMGLLLVTLISGVNLNSASRWLTIPGIGLTFQPSEMAKLALIVYVANILARHQKDDQPTKEAFWPILIHVGLVAGLIFTENLSTALLIVAVSVAMMFVGRVPFRYLLTTGVVVVGFTALVLVFAKHVDFLPRAKTWSSRFEQFFNPQEANPASNYQADQSKIAIASGGFLGIGPGNSVQRNFLPHPYSDFIYAIIAEEYGFVGALVILICYLLLLARVGYIVGSSKRTFPAFMAFGLGLMLASQAFLNMGVAVGIFPVTGQPLPLVSLGTTSVLFTCVAFGLILGVSRINMEQKELENEVIGQVEE